MQSLGQRKGQTAAYLGIAGIANPLSEIANYVSLLIIWMRNLKIKMGYCTVYKYRPLFLDIRQTANSPTTFHVYAPQSQWMTYPPCLLL